MSSFKATLTVDNVPYNLSFCKFIYHQNTNPDGNPSSALQGGIISLVLEKPAPKSLLGWMLSPTDKRDGAIRFYEVNILSGTHQSLSFENAGCITFRSTFNGNKTGTGALITSVVLSAQNITFLEEKLIK